MGRTNFVEDERIEAKTLTKKLIGILLTIFLALGIVGAVGGYYCYINQLWMFENPIPPVGLPTELALHGAEPASTTNWQYAQCAPVLRRHIEENGETRQFALDFYKYKDTDFDTDISGEVEEGEMPLLIQWDKRWGYRIYGTNYMGNNACGPTCMSMLYVGLTGDTSMNPYEMAKFAEARGYYLSQVGTKWALMEDGAEELGLTVEIYEKDQVADVEAVHAALEAGKPVICPMGPGDFTRGGHFIILTGIDENNQVSVLDPNSPKRSAMLWDFDQVMSQTKYAWGYSYTPGEQVLY